MCGPNANFLWEKCSFFQWPALSQPIGLLVAGLLGCSWIWSSDKCILCIRDLKSEWGGKWTVLVTAADGKWIITSIEWKSSARGLACILCPIANLCLQWYKFNVLLPADWRITFGSWVKANCTSQANPFPHFQWELFYTMSLGKGTTNMIY